MGLADVFGKDDRVEVKTVNLYEMLIEGAKTTSKSEVRKEVIIVGHGYSDVLAGIYEHMNKEKTSEEESQ